MSLLRELRDEYKKAKEQFDQDKRREWDLIVRGYEIQMAAEARRMHDSGMTKAAIMREYGTSDFRTVDRLINRGKPTGTKIKPQWVDNGDGSWTVTNGKDEAVVIPIHEEKELIVEKGVLPAGIGYSDVPRAAD